MVGRGYRDGMDRKKEGGEGKLEGYGREDIETSGGEAHRQLKREKQGEEKEQGEGRGKEWKGSRRDTSGEEVNIDWQLASTLRVFAQRQDPTRRGPCQHDDFRPELHSIPPSRYTVHYDTRAADTWEKPAILAAIPDPLGIHPAVLHCNWGSTPLYACFRVRWDFLGRASRVRSLAQTYSATIRTVAPGRIASPRCFPECRPVQDGPPSSLARTLVARLNPTVVPFP